MSGPAIHALAGAAGGVLPDLALTFFVRRATWLPPSHPLYRLHRQLHQPHSIVVPITVGWLTHLTLDRYTRHRLTPTLKGRRGWRW